MANEVLGFLAALTSRAAPHCIPEKLARLARRVAGNDADADDLLGDLLLGLVDATRRGTGKSAAHLVGLVESQAVAALRYRLRQIQAEKSPRRRTTKQLREAVRSVLAAGLPAAPAQEPVSLMVDGRFSRAGVAAALAWIMAEEPDLPGSDAVALADRLYERWLEPQGIAESEFSTDSTDGTVAERLDAERLLGRLEEEAGLDLTRIIRARLSGASLSGIARSEGVAVATVHARLNQALARIHELSEPVPNRAS